MHGNEVTGVLIERIVEPAVVDEFLRLRRKIRGNNHGSTHFPGCGEVWFPRCRENSTTLNQNVYKLYANSFTHEIKSFGIYEIYSA